jgi:alpha-glucosidase
VITRSKELLMRWMELNAFTALFRTHVGFIPKISAQVDTDAETLSHFSTFSFIYRSLGTYRRGVVEEAAKRGYPVVRHLFLHFPEDPVVYSLRYQFMLGFEFLIAPVLNPRASVVRAYLPSGKWTTSGLARTTCSARGRECKSQHHLANRASFSGRDPKPVNNSS